MSPACRCPSLLACGQLSARLAISSEHSALSLLQLCPPLPFSQFQTGPVAPSWSPPRPGTALTLTGQRAAWQSPSSALAPGCAALRRPPSLPPQSLQVSSPGTQARDFWDSRGYTPAPTHRSQPILKGAHAEMPHSGGVAVSPLPVEQTLRAAGGPQSSTAGVCGVSSPRSSHEVASPPHAPEEGTGVERVTPPASTPRLWEGPLGRDRPASLVLSSP